MLNGLNADVSALGTTCLPVGTQFTTHRGRLKKAEAPLTSDFTPDSYVSVKRKPATNPAVAVPGF